MGTVQKNNQNVEQQQRFAGHLGAGKYVQMVKALGAAGLAVLAVGCGGSDGGELFEQKPERFELQVQLLEHVGPSGGMEKVYSKMWVQDATVYGYVCFDSKGIQKPVFEARMLMQGQVLEQELATRIHQEAECAHDRFSGFKLVLPPIGDVQVQLSYADTVWAVGSAQLGVLKSVALSSDGQTDKQQQKLGTWTTKGNGVVQPIQRPSISKVVQVPYMESGAAFDTDVSGLWGLERLQRAPRIFGAKWVAPEGASAFEQGVYQGQTGSDWLIVSGVWGTEKKNDWTFERWREHMQQLKDGYMSVYGAAPRYVYAIGEVFWLYEGVSGFKRGILDEQAQSYQVALAAMREVFKNNDKTKLAISVNPAALYAKEQLMAGVFKEVDVVLVDPYTVYDNWFWDYFGGWEAGCGGWRAFDTAQKVFVQCAKTYLGDKQWIYVAQGFSNSTKSIHEQQLVVNAAELLDLSNSDPRGIGYSLFGFWVSEAIQKAEPHLIPGHTLEALVNWVRWNLQ